MLMLSAITVPASSPPGTVVAVASAWNGSQTVNANWILDPNAAGFFAMVGAKLTTLWTAPIPPGYYAVTLTANGVAVPMQGEARFVIQVTP